MTSTSIPRSCTGTWRSSRTPPKEIDPGDGDGGASFNQQDTSTHQLKGGGDSFRFDAKAGERIESAIGAVELTHVNLYDGTIEGIRALDVPAGCVQYHPEAGPGPNDSLELFDEFIGRFAHAA